MATYQLEDVGTRSFRCPLCGWTGKGDAADVRPDNVVRCPDCGEALEREE
jgi:predicted RNA-binding Zn-ribbon protein involved in translation (DUF1610 family)